MASLGFLETLLNGLSDLTSRVILKQCFTELIKNERWGPVAHQTPTQMGARIYVDSTTPASSNTEFSILHGLGRAPYVVVKVLALDSTGNQDVPLVNSRVADAMRIYLRSPSTSAAFSLMVE